MLTTRAVKVLRRRFAAHIPRIEDGVERALVSGDYSLPSEPAFSTGE